jgi:UDP-N-acetylglucosamine enolpyruvyl transferase
LERAWRPRYGERLVDQLFSALQQIGAGAPLSESSLMAALEPHPEGWRAALPPPSVLPHFPMVLHRGGYPDGS